MKIRAVDTYIIEIPFVDGGAGEGLTPTRWHTLETVLVRLEDEDGVVGWGEGFGYFTADATKAMIDRNIAPLLRGSIVEDVTAWNLETQRRLHLFGRYGITMFAISGVDIALWDLAAKRAGLPLHRTIAEESRQQVPFYASLVRYADTNVAPAMCERALSRGFTDLKIHETTDVDIRACSAVVGVDVPIAVDVNCTWSEAFAASMCAVLDEIGITWLEEPIFPPEDLHALRRLRGHGLPIAAGENWCTSFPFEAALAVGAVDHLQPSVTKVGGITEFLKIDALAVAAGIDLLPHSPYFGPGFFASLQLAAALPSVRRLEYLFVEPEAWLVELGGPGSAGGYDVPDAPGIGFEPDPKVLERYRRA